MNTDAFSSLVTFLSQLEQKQIHYSLGHNREESIMVFVATPGERWEIEFLSDGAIEVEKFVSTGEIVGAESFGELFATYKDEDDAADALEKVMLAPVAGKVA